MLFNATMTILPTILHALVDCLCVAAVTVLYGVAGAPGGFLGVVLCYNVAAFLSQPFTGLVCDHVGRADLQLLVSALLLCVGVALLPWANAYVVAATLGLGNSLFHVWGGRVVALGSGNDMRHLGVFVSAGALGLGCAAVWPSVLLVVGCLVGVCVGCLAVVLRRPRPAGPAAPAVPPLSGGWLLWGGVLLVMLAVMLRSFVGEVFARGLSLAGPSPLLVGAMVMAGKAAGGFVARAAGWQRAAAVLVVGTTACLLLRGHGLPVAVAGLLMVNATMAITLYLANRLLPGSEGLAFGLLAAALMPGYLLSQVGTDVGTMLPRLLWTLVPTVLIELAVLWLLLERRSRVLASSVLVNVLTNVPLNLLLLFYGVTATGVVAGELVVLLLEWLWYWRLTRRLGLSFLYSLLCNGFSFFLGLLAQVCMA